MSLPNTLPNTLTKERPPTKARATLKRASALWRVQADPFPAQLNGSAWARSQPSAAKPILSLIGNTPLVDLSDFAHAHGLPAGVKLFAKAEWYNLSGSVKARPALRIVEDAEKRGDLGPGKILIDSSSGNTGIAFAMIGAAKGYETHIVVPGNVSAERKALIRAYGATLIETDPLEGPQGAMLAVRDLVAADPDRYYYANQYDNPSNWQAHYHSTGPEIWNQTGGGVTHFVAALGTTGTFTGTGRYLRERNPAIELVSIQPVDEFSNIEGVKHLDTAIVPRIYDDALPDRVVRVSPERAWETARELGRGAGLFVGISAGAAVSGSIEAGQALNEGVIVTILPDDGSKYLSLGIFDE